jgi:hypothetical protein
VVHVDELFFPNRTAIHVKKNIFMVCMEMPNQLAHFLTADNQVVQAWKMRMCQFKETEGLLRVKPAKLWSVVE